MIKNTTDRLRQNSLGYIFIFPALFVLVAMIVYPMLYGIGISFFDTNLVNKWKFIGLKYYVRLLTDENFGRSIVKTLIFTFGTVAGRTFLGLLFATILVDKRIPFKPLFRSIIVLPWFFPDVVIGLLWKWLYNTNYGLINHLLLGLNMIKAPVEWLSNSSTAMGAVILVSIWKGFPFMVVMLMAALQTVSQDLYEAAEIDGCGRIGKFLHVTLPGIAPVLSTTVMLESMWSFKHFTLIWNLTYGGPVDATNVVSIDIYKTGFQYMRFGESATRAVYVFIIVIVISLLQRKFKNSKGY